MLSLSPAKLLVILVIALIVLGPDKLPQVARQIGAVWHDLREWRSRIETEVRGTFPNLPPTHEVAQAVRSPLAFLDRLADDHEKELAEQPTEASTDPAGSETGGPAPPGAGAVPSDATSANGSSGNGSAPDNGSLAGNGAMAHNGSVGHNGSSAGESPAPRTADAPVERAGAPAPGAFPAVPDDPSMN
jgi:sec-independent protein translocase protein TatB